MPLSLQTPGTRLLPATPSPPEPAGDITPAVMTASTEPRPGPHGAAPVTGCRTSANRKGNHHAPTVGSLDLAGNRRGTGPTCVPPTQPRCLQTRLGPAPSHMCLPRNHGTVARAALFRPLVWELSSGAEFSKNECRREIVDWQPRHVQPHPTQRRGRGDSEGGACPPAARFGPPLGLSNVLSYSPGGLTKQPDNK